MCKGPNEPGGPYRCSDDMATKFARAQSDWMVRVEEARAAADEHDLARERLSAFVAAAADHAEGTERMEGMSAEVRKTEAALSKARAHEDTARAEMQTASREYDATRRGLGALALELSEAQRSGDEVHIRRTNRRIADAIAMMNDEMRQRQQRNPTSRQQPLTHETLSQTSSIAPTTVAPLVASDHVSAIAKLFPGESGNQRRQITLFRAIPDEPKPREVEFTYVGGRPTTDQLVFDMAFAARSYHASGDNFDRFCEVRDVATTRGSGARGMFTAARKAHKDLLNLFGEERARGYMLAA